METVSLSSTVSCLMIMIKEVCSFSVILGRAVLKPGPTGESFACQVIRHSTFSSAGLLEESVR